MISNCKIDIMANFVKFEIFALNSSYNARERRKNS